MTQQTKLCLAKELDTERVDTPAATSLAAGGHCLRALCVYLNHPSVLRDNGLTKLDRRFNGYSDPQWP